MTGNVGIAGPKSDITPLSGQGDCEGGAKSTSTRDAHRSGHAFAPFFPDPIIAGAVWSNGQRGRADSVASS